MSTDTYKFRFAEGDTYIPETDEEKDWLGKKDFSNSAEDAYTG